MEIQHKHESHAGMFFIEEADETLAKLDYTMRNNKMVINHTEVSEKLAGQGIGKQLVVKAVEFARAQGIKILPYCPYAKKVIEREFQDVL